MPQITLLIKNIFCEVQIYFLTQRPSGVRNSLENSEIQKFISSLQTPKIFYPKNGEAWTCQEIPFHKIRDQVGLAIFIHTRQPGREILAQQDSPMVLSPFLNFSINPNPHHQISKNLTKVSLFFREDKPGRARAQ
jgi:hypothetical protein